MVLQTVSEDINQPETDFDFINDRVAEAFQLFREKVLALISAAVMVVIQQIIPELSKQLQQAVKEAGQQIQEQVKNLKIDPTELLTLSAKVDGHQMRNQLFHAIAYSLTQAIYCQIAVRHNLFQETANILVRAIAHNLQQELRKPNQNNELLGAIASRLQQVKIKQDYNAKAPAKQNSHADQLERVANPQADHPDTEPNTGAALPEQEFWEKQVAENLMEAVLQYFDKQQTYKQALSIAFQRSQPYELSNWRQKNGEEKKGLMSVYLLNKLMRFNEAPRPT